MNIEDKMKIVKEIYNKLNINNYSFKTKRDEEVQADYIWIDNTRGVGGIIIGDDGSYLFCQSIHDYNYWKEQFKQGIRTNK